jgi:pimeloyl-ACP methyl ester carboxylesterase
MVSYETMIPRSNISSSTSRKLSGNRKYSHTQWEITWTGYRCPLHDSDPAPTNSPLRHDQPEDHPTQSTNVTAPAALLGHSLGAINAYQFAARHPERVTALINGEGCAELGLDGSNPLAFVLNLPEGTCPSREAFVAQLGPFAPFFESAVREQPDGTWGLHFHPKDICDSEDQVHGDHWADWTGSACPTLLIRGAEGGGLPAEQAAQMAARRPGTRLVELGTDHFLYANDPVGSADAVRDFLASA